MKKIFTAIILFSLSILVLFNSCKTELSQTSDGAEEDNNPVTSSSPLVGNWYLQKIVLFGNSVEPEFFPSQMGISMRIEIDDDFTYRKTTTANSDSEVEEGIWGTNGSRITFSSGDVNNPDRTYIYNLTELLTATCEFLIGAGHYVPFQGRLEFSNQDVGNPAIELNEAEAKLVGEWDVKKIEYLPNRFFILVPGEGGFYNSNLVITDNKTMTTNYFNENNQTPQLDTLHQFETLVWSATADKIIAVDPNFGIQQMPYTFENNDLTLNLTMQYNFNLNAQSLALWIMNKK